jgi:hypothetical protein
MENRRYICIMESFYRNRHWNPGDLFTTDLPVRCANFRLLREDEHPRGQAYPIEKTYEDEEQEKRITLATERPLPGSPPRRPPWNPTAGTGTKIDYDVLHHNLK